MSNADGHIELKYSNSKVSKRTYFESGISSAYAYDIFSYNTDGNVEIIKSYYEENGQFILYYEYGFSYSNGKLTKFDVREYDLNTGNIVLSANSDYVYTGNNISKSVNTDFTIAGSDTVTYVYLYDNNDNYLAKNNALLTDYLFMEEIDGSTLPLIFSKNNVIRVLDDPDEIPITYNLDSKNNFYEFYIDGELASRFLYDCK
jgi:hypothetical protein